MTGVVTGIVATTVPLVLLGLVAAWRWRLAAAVVIVLGAIGTAVGLGILVPTDLWVVPQGVQLAEPLMLVLLWTAFGAVARTTGPLAVPGPAWLVAMLMGAGLGEIPAAAILSASAASPKGAARLALAAAGGGLIGRVGDPAMLILASNHPALLAGLVPLGIACALVARPSPDDLVLAEDGNRVRTAVVFLVAVAALLPQVAPWALMGGILALGLLAQDRRCLVDLAGVGWQLCAVIVAVLAVVGGAAEQAAFGFEWAAEMADWMGPPVLTLVSAILTAFTDGTGMSIFAAATVDRAMSVDAMALLPALTAGIAVGGLAPLIAAGAVRSGLKIWLLQVGLAVLWAAAWGLM